MVAKLFKHIYDLSGTHPEYDKTTNWVTGSGTSGPQTRDFLRRYFTTGDLINGWDGNAAFLSLQKANWYGLAFQMLLKKASHAFCDRWICLLETSNEIFG